MIKNQFINNSVDCFCTKRKEKAVNGYRPDSDSFLVDGYFISELFDDIRRPSNR